MVHVQPSAWRKADLPQLAAAKQTVLCAWSPRDNTLASFTTTSQPSTSQSASRATPHEADIYLTNLHRAPSKLRREFISDTYPSFVKFTRQVRELRERGSFGVHDADIYSAFSNIADDYLVVLRAHIEKLMRHDPNSSSVARYQTVHSSLQLAQTLFMPAGGSRAAVVGEELLDWLNQTWIEPRTEEGLALSGLVEPWNDDNFWPYLTRSILRGHTDSACVFVAKLEEHPSPYLQHLAIGLGRLVKNHPRSTNFADDNEFFSAWREWKVHVTLIRTEFDNLPSNEGRGSWRAPLSELVSILQGDEEALLRVCKETEAGWREALCLWGVWRESPLRRDDLQALLQNTILPAIPPDVDIAEEMLHLALFEVDLGKAVELATAIDIWLAAHMIDLLAPLNVLDDMTEHDSTTALRDYLVMSYAEYLRTDPHLWRITADYMYACGPVGEQSADQVLLAVPLQGHTSAEEPATGSSMELDTVSGANGEIIAAFDALSAICREHKREHVRRRICRNAARTFLQRREYGLAISYSISGEDLAGVGRASGCLLEEFVDHGPQLFLEKVDQIATDLRMPDVVGQEQIYLSRLRFVQRYADFQRLLASGNILDAAEHLIDILTTELVPKAWVAVLLADAGRLLDTGELIFRIDEVHELIGRLELLQSRVGQRSGVEYLGVLTRIEAREKDGLGQQRLDLVRLSLARYFARCTHHVGGRGLIVEGL